MEWVLTCEQGGSIEDNASVVVFSDSLSSLQSLRSQKSECRPNLINEIVALMNRVTSQLSIVWIPGHSGIKGNDCADRLAKESLNKPAVDVVVSNDSNEATEALIDAICR